MDINDTSYIEFLKIYYPATADTVAALKGMSPKGDTPEELKKSTAEIEEKINAALNKSDCVSDFRAYEKIPQGIRTRYAGTKVPDDVMDAARRDEVLTLMEMEQHPEIKRVEDAREAVREKYGIPSGIEIPEAVTSAAALVLFASAIKAGYSQEACRTLALQSQHREGLLEEKAAILTNPNLSDAEKKEKLHDWLEHKWLKSKRDSVKTIKEDRAEHQPEKHLVYLLNQFNRHKISKEELMPQIADLVQKIDTEGRHDALLKHLKDHPAILRHYKKDTLDILANSVLNKMPQISEAEREKILTQHMRKKRELKEDMTDDKKAATVAKDLKVAQDNALPKKSSLSTEEKRANMPTVLKRNGIQRES